MFLQPDNFGAMPRHNKVMSGDNIEEILRNTLRVLCSNSVSYGVQISVDALIGITVDSSEVILVNIHEQLDKSGNQLSSGYGAQHPVKSEFLDDAEVNSFVQPQENYTAATDDSSDYTLTNRTVTGTAGFGSSGQGNCDVDDDGLGYDEEIHDAEEGQYMEVFQPDDAGEFEDEYFGAGMGHSDGQAGAYVYDVDVKPFSMDAYHDGGYYPQMHKAITVPGRKRRGAAVSRRPRGSPATPRRQPKTTVKDTAAGYDETNDLPSSLHSQTVLASEKSTVYTCLVCGKMIRHAGSFQRHKQQHEGLVFRCDLCGTVLSRRDVLTAHRRKCEAKMMQQSSAEPFDAM